jgi:hypothetical protein
MRAACQGFDYCAVNVSDAVLGVPQQANGAPCSLGTSAYV